MLPFDKWPCDALFHGNPLNLQIRMSSFVHARDGLHVITSAVKGEFDFYNDGGFDSYNGEGI